MLSVCSIELRPDRTIGLLNPEQQTESDMSKSRQQTNDVDVGGQHSESKPKDATLPTTEPRGQKVSLERGKATHKKNPGKRPRSGGS